MGPRKGKLKILKGKFGGRGEPRYILAITRPGEIAEGRALEEKIRKRPLFQKKFPRQMWTPEVVEGCMNPGQKRLNEMFAKLFPSKKLWKSIAKGRWYPDTNQIGEVECFATIHAMKSLPGITEMQRKKIIKFANLQKKEQMLLPMQKAAAILEMEIGKEYYNELMARRNEVANWMLDVMRIKVWEIAKEKEVSYRQPLLGRGY
ncbi:MAG: hypothetical protein NTZ73_04560 [Candidatus Diapherotrites archaeon]|nr:hypothetical protein [Candidatus Diapherotrites archaeon]